MDRPPQPSPLSAALGRVGDRWKLLVIDVLLDGPGRFSDLERAIPDISTNILSARLRELEQDGLVVADAYSDRPRRHEYSLTATGKELAGALQLLADWGARHGEGLATNRHDLCGTPLEVRWYCPTCGAITDRTEPVWFA
jgi:DNA-binding HxlR family transcriptional regulator